MRLLLFILGIGAGVIGIGNRAEAQNYPWCGVYRDGVMICSFTTFQQCLSLSAKLGSAYKTTHTKHRLRRVRRPVSKGSILS